jgi:hypothetical protein
MTSATGDMLTEITESKVWLMAGPQLRLRQTTGEAKCSPSKSSIRPIVHAEPPLPATPRRRRTLYTPTPVQQPAVTEGEFASGV